MYRGGYKLHHFGQFLAKRCVRIEPPYLISLFLVLTWYTIGSFDPYYSGPPVIWDFGRIASHVGYITPWIGHKWYIDVYWTLAIEFQYYLIVALVFPLLFHGQKWVRILTLIGLALPALVLKDNRLMPHFGALFVMGMVLAHYFSSLLSLLETLVIIAVCAIISNYSLSWKDTSAGLLAVSVILTVTQSWKFTDFLGKISYSLYLTHILVWMFFSGIYNKPSTGLALRYEVLAISVLGCLLFAYGFYILVEKPCMDWGKRLTYRRSSAEHNL